MISEVHVKLLSFGDLVSDFRDTVGMHVLLL